MSLVEENLLENLEIQENLLGNQKFEKSKRNIENSRKLEKFRSRKKISPLNGKTPVQEHTQQSKIT